MRVIEIGRLEGRTFILAHIIELLINEKIKQSKESPESTRQRRESIETGDRKKKMHSDTAGQFGTAAFLKLFGLTDNA